jgi:hypothetical protein
MLFLYNTGIYLYTLFIRIASFNNKKAAAWIKGRKGLLELIEKIWTKANAIPGFILLHLGSLSREVRCLNN